MKTLKSEEAITVLEDMKIDIPIPKATVTQIKRNVALNMAIDALLRRSEISNDSDTISRQDAIKTINNVRDVCDTESLDDYRDLLVECFEVLPSAQFKRINKGIHEITESDKISYAVICDKFPSPHVYFNTYDEAEHWARFNQPNYRPYYIVERSEHFEIVGKVR